VEGNPRKITPVDFVFIAIQDDRAASRIVRFIVEWRAERVFLASTPSFFAQNAEHRMFRSI